jgi:hypothetical protein
MVQDIDADTLGICFSSLALSISLVNFNHFKVFFANATIWTHPIGWHILPQRTWRNAVIWPALSFVINKTTDNTHPLFHDITLRDVTLIDAAADATAIEINHDQMETHMAQSNKQGADDT